MNNSTILLIGCFVIGLNLAYSYKISDYGKLGANGFPKTGEQYAITPWKTINFTLEESVKCTGSIVQHIQVRNVTVATPYTCNGYESLETKWDYSIIVGGKVEPLSFDKLHIYLSFINGDMNEINSGVVTSGRCAGDVFFLSNAYVADDQFGCSGDKGLSSLTARYIEARLTGPKCGPAICVMESGTVKLNPPVRNN